MHQFIENFVSSGLFIPLTVLGVPVSIGVGAMIVQAIGYFRRRSGDSE